MKTMDAILREVYGIDQSILLKDLALDESDIDIYPDRKKNKKGTSFSMPQEMTEKPQLFDLYLMAGRMNYISNSVVNTISQNIPQVGQAVDLLAEWIQTRAVVRFLGAGRALLAGSMPGNRLAHAGVRVSFMGGMVPLPNSIEGGGIISCSASGKTSAVLQAMEIAKNLNPNIKILGIASKQAPEFAQLCDVFIGIGAFPSEFPNPLSALADTEEYIISEILDGLVVLAGRKLGFDDLAWRNGHEDIGPTGPYSPKERS